jgi:hypothetical protein
MKFYLLVVVLFISLGCKQSGTNTQQLQNRIDSLRQKLATTYKPGFGEFMSGIQVHHAKLWFAGINNNWDLADFEVHEITEALENLQIFQVERKETKSLPMMNPALDSVNNAIQQKDPVLFKKSYTLLTASCNDCHKAVDYSFNEVKIPDTPPFSNQVFKRK